jgi:hypothetical protein
MTLYIDDFACFQVIEYQDSLISYDRIHHNRVWYDIELEIELNSLVMLEYDLDIRSASCKLFGCNLVLSPLYI